MNPNKHIKTINNYYVILTTYMLDSALEPSYKVEKVEKKGKEKEKERRKKGKRKV